MTNEELRADLLDDPQTAEIAEEQGMTVEAYIAATIAFCDDPDAGFAGGGIDAPDCAHTEHEPDDGPSAFDEAQKPKTLPNTAPGEGVTGSMPAFVVKAGSIRG